MLSDTAVFSERKRVLLPDPNPDTQQLPLWSLDFTGTGPWKEDLSWGCCSGRELFLCVYVEGVMHVESMLCRPLPEDLQFEHSPYCLLCLFIWCHPQPRVSPEDFQICHQAQVQSAVIAVVAGFKVWCENGKSRWGKQWFGGWRLRQLCDEPCCYV